MREGIVHKKESIYGKKTLILSYITFIIQKTYVWTIFREIEIIMLYKYI